jgi:hypothetical protein
MFTQANAEEVLMTFGRGLKNFRIEAHYFTDHGDWGEGIYTMYWTHGKDDVQADIVVNTTGTNAADRLRREAKLTVEAAITGLKHRYDEDISTKSSSFTDRR